MTILIVTFDNIIPQMKMVNCVRYAIMVSLFCVSIAIKKKFPEQKLMAFSLFFVIIADFFLVLSKAIDQITVNLDPFGIAGFACAYICLISVYQKNFGRAKKAELISAIPFIIIYIIVSLTLFIHIHGVMKIGAIIFGVILAYMAWTSVCTIFRNYYKKDISVIIAISGVLMFICDIGVAYTIFHPYFSTVYIPLLKNVIWISYIIGWTLLDVIISEEKSLKI